MNQQQNLSAAEQFTRTIGIALSQYHSAAISEITKRGMLYRVERGYAVTRPPLGYSKTVTPGLYELNNYGLSARNTLQVLANGETNVGTVVAYLDILYHAMTGIDLSGTKWLNRILRNPYYTGHICHKGQLYPGLHEPLISEDDYKKLLVVLENHNGNDHLKSVAKSL
jgi:site-specific DNA recombinase